jgi:hypothetical protein
MTPEAPQLEDIHLEKLISKIKTDSTPIYVDIKAESEAAIIECFPNVERKIKSDGGNMVFGWAIWKTKLFIEAEYHGIWNSPEGELIDITPRTIPSQKILFLRDTENSYNGCQVDNIRVNISGNTLADDLIILYESKFNIENKGNRAFEYELHLEGEEAKFHTLLHLMIIQVFIMLEQGLTKNQTCFCGKAKYKKCHGKLVQAIKNVL